MKKKIVFVDGELGYERYCKHCSYLVYDNGAYRCDNPSSPNYNTYPMLYDDVGCDAY